MTELQLLLTDNVIDPDEEKEVVIGKRKIKGKPVDLVCTIKRLSQDKQIELQQKYTKRSKNGNEIETFPMLVEAIRLGCQNPNFRDIEWHKQLDVTSPKEAMMKVLSSVEMSTLAGEIIAFSGMTDDEFNEAREETKN